MRFRPEDGEFLFPNPDHPNNFFPNQIIKAGRIDNAVKDDAFFHVEQRVIWRTRAGVCYPMTIIPFEMPSGAADITLGTMATSATGARTYTPSVEGMLLSNTGVLVPTAGAPATVGTIAGLLFTDYYFDGPGLAAYNDKLPNYALALEEGDFTWLIREADEIELYASEAVDDGDALVSSGATAGAVVDAATFDTGGTIAAYHTTVLNNIPGHYLSKCIGYCRETIGAAGLFDADLRLPKFVRRHTV